MSYTIHTNHEELGKSNNIGILSFAKVFLYMFIGLGLTTVVAFAVGGAFYLAGTRGADPDMLYQAGLITTIISAIALVILMFIINLVTLRGNHSLVLPMTLYCVLMGVVLSWFTLLVDWRLLGLAFGITSGVFLLMTLIAVLTKGNMHPLLMVGIGLFFGAGVLSLLNFFFFNQTIYWIVSFSIFAAVMFITMFDIWNIKNICQRGAMNENLALYCAFQLYVDFIYILVRIIYFLIIIFGRSR